MGAVKPESVELSATDFVWCFRSITHHKPKDKAGKITTMRIIKAWEGAPHFGKWENEGGEEIKGILAAECRKCDKVFPIDQTDTESRKCPKCGELSFRPPKMLVAVSRGSISYLWDVMKEGNRELRLPALKDASYNEITSFRRLAKALGKTEDCEAIIEEWLIEEEESEPEKPKEKKSDAKAEPKPGPAAGTPAPAEAAPASA